MGKLCTKGVTYRLRLLVKCYMRQLLGLPSSVYVNLTDPRHANFTMKVEHLARLNAECMAFKACKLYLLLERTSQV